MGPPELLIVAVIAVAVLFGAKKIPEIARSVGRAQGEFKKGIKEGHVDDQAETPAAPPAAAAPPATAPPATPEQADRPSNPEAHT
jgi:sec-independent protein translocase protein TatA